MRRALAVLGAVLTAVAFTITACSSSPAHGRVISKTYQPAHTTWTTQTRTRRVCTTTRSRRTSRRSCSSVPVGMHRAAHHTAACWQLHLNTGQALCVTASRWQHTHIGDHI